MGVWVQGRITGVSREPSEGLTKHGYHSLREIWKRALQTSWERAFRVNTSILFRKTRETGVGTGTEGRRNEL